MINSTSSCKCASCKVFRVFRAACQNICARRTEVTFYALFISSDFEFATIFVGHRFFAWFFPFVTLLYETTAWATRWCCGGWRCLFNGDLYNVSFKLAVAASLLCKLFLTTSVRTHAHQETKLFSVLAVGQNAGVKSL